MLIINKCIYDSLAADIIESAAGGRRIETTAEYIGDGIEVLLYVTGTACYTTEIGTIIDCDMERWEHISRIDIDTWAVYCFRSDIRVDSDFNISKIQQRLIF